MRVLAPLLVLLTGCTLYFGEDDPPPPCYYPGSEGGGGAIAPLNLRDPETGECSLFGGGGWCDDRCGPCAAELTPLPDWGYCETACDALDEQTCLGTSGCYAAYAEADVTIEPWPLPPAKTVFQGCRAVAPSGPVQGGGCWNLDAQECSRHDDCSLYYTPVYGPTNTNEESFQFAFCAPEPSIDPTCGGVDCGPGYRCEEQCYACDDVNGPCEPQCFPTCVPDGSSSCAAVDCQPGYECVEVCTPGGLTGGGCTMPGECSAQCVPVGGGGDPGQCTGDVLCDAIPPACPSGTVPGIKNGCWSGYCIPQHACGPNDPGTCDDHVICAAAAPACPMGTVPGVANGCYTGYCIPQHQCPAPTCETLTDEMACLSQPDCTPVYTGGDCTCTPAGCTCEELTFARCETWFGTPMPL